MCTSCSLPWRLTLSALAATRPRETILRKGVRSRTDLAPRLLRATERKGAVRVQGRDQSSRHRGKWNSRVKPARETFKTGEFVLGYPDETSGFPPMPQPEVLGRNGTYAVVRKLHQRVAAFKLYLRANSPSLQEEELLAAKMMGHGAAAHPWRSPRNVTISR